MGENRVSQTSIREGFGRRLGTRVRLLIIWHDEPKGGNDGKRVQPHVSRRTYWTRPSVFFFFVRFDFPSSLWKLVWVSLGR
jgi:hypothetical protein